MSLYDQPLLSQRISREFYGTPYAWVRCRGYSWTCEWEVYNQSATGSRATNTQIEDILSAECPFVASMDVAASGNSVERFRDANQTAWKEILRLMALGDSSNNPLLGGVWEDRAFVVETLPTTVGYKKRVDGRYEDADGGLVDPWLLRMADVVPGAPTFTPEMDDPRNVVIWKASYEDEQERLTITPLHAEDLAEMILGQLEPWR